MVICTFFFLSYKGVTTFTGIDQLQLRKLFDNPKIVVIWFPRILIMLSKKLGWASDGSDMLLEGTVQTWTQGKHSGAWENNSAILELEENVPGVDSSISMIGIYRFI